MFFSLCPLSFSMVSSSTVSAMVELRANGIEIPLLFPVDANGFASVYSLQLNIIFSFQDTTIWVERDIYDTSTSLLSLTMWEDHRIADHLCGICARVNTGCMDSWILP